MGRHYTCFDSMDLAKGNGDFEYFLDLFMCVCFKFTCYALGLG